MAAVKARIEKLERELKLVDQITVSTVADVAIFMRDRKVGVSPSPGRFTKADIAMLDEAVALAEARLAREKAGQHEV